MTPPLRICRLDGDGIGPEVVRAAVRVLDAMPLEIEWVPAPIGFGCWQQTGDPLPAGTLEAVRDCGLALFGAVTTPPDVPNYRSPILRLRQELALFANVRPCRSIPHPSSREAVNLVIVRENTEDVYVGREWVEDEGDTAIGEMRITRQASERIARYACELARKAGHTRVTVVHKANVLRETSGLFRRTALRVAMEFPDLIVDDMLVDSCAMALIRDPGRFGVIVTTNLFGDILSDEASMLVGGLGVAASANVGAEAAVFEPVHGSAPDIAGTGKANPLAAILSAALLLEHANLAAHAEALRKAVGICIRTGQVTPDLGGSLTTQSAADAVIRNLEL